MEQMSKIGNRVKTLRLNKKLSQTDLAKLMDVSKSVISGYEKSSLYPSVETLLKLADYFGVTTDYILARPNKTVDVTGLNDNEVEGIVLLISSLRKKEEK